jgi:hypothetical protein
MTHMFFPHLLFDFSVMVTDPLSSLSSQLFVDGGEQDGGAKALVPKTCTPYHRSCSLYEFHIELPGREGREVELQPVLANTRIWLAPAFGGGRWSVRPR